jgi:flavin-binding protein dodecin
MSREALSTPPGGGGKAAFESECRFILIGRSRVRYNTPMTAHTYSISEIVGTSPDGIDQAIRNGIARANQTVRNLDWFEVREVRGYVSDGEIDHFQVRMKLGFRLEDSGSGAQ